MAQTKVPTDRLRQIWFIAYVFSALIAFRLIDIQILRHQQYKEAAERNRTHIIYQVAPRGRMITRDSVVIATNQPAFSLIYLPGRFKDPSYMTRLVKDFSSRLNIDPDDLRDTVQTALKTGRPIRLAENLSTKSMFALSELKTLYPGVDIIVETKRFYPYGNFASHLVGYMGKISPKELTSFRADGLDYRMDSTVGKNGIEKWYEPYLKGKDGGLYLEVDFMGRLKRILQNEPWVAGADLHLTIDYETQKAAEEGLKKSLTQTGAVVAIDPRNGAILALASSPDFDPNMFVSYSDSSTVRVKNLPEFNLALQGTYAPASTFKIIVGAAALESGRVSPDEKYYCSGSFNTGGRVFKCWEKKGHGDVDFDGGLTHSCDVYFYNVAMKLGPAIIEQYERLFRLGQPSGIPLLSEKSGHIFGPNERAERKSYWFIGDTLNLSIGQGELLVTPIQMTQVIAAVANGGYFWRPHYLERIVDTRNKVLFQKKVELLSQVNLKPENWELLRGALKDVIDNGTGAAARIKDINVYGKTGTGQNPQGGDNAWFVAYAEEPGEKSRVAVCVLIQHGLHGASASAPIAKQVIEAALRRPKSTAPAPAASDGGEF